MSHDKTLVACMLDPLRKLEIYCEGDPLDMESPEIRDADPDSLFCRIRRALRPSWLPDDGDNDWDGVWMPAGDEPGERLVLVDRLLNCRHLSDAIGPRQRRRYDDMREDWQEADLEMSIAWTWMPPFVEEDLNCHTGTTRTFYKDGTRASEEFKFFGKREGRNRFWRKDGTLDEERSGWFENDVKMPEQDDCAGLKELKAAAEASRTSWREKLFGVLPGARTILEGGRHGR